MASVDYEVHKSEIQQLRSLSKPAVVLLNDRLGMVTCSDTAFTSVLAGEGASSIELSESLRRQIAGLIDPLATPHDDRAVFLPIDDGLIAYARVLRGNGGTFVAILLEKYSVRREDCLH